MPKSPLAPLVAASSPDQVESFFGQCFRHRHSLDTVNRARLKSWFKVDGEAATQLLQAGRDVVLSALYVSATLTSAEEIGFLLDDSLDERLKTLIARIIAEQLPSWRKASVDSRVSMPRLVDVDWRVDVKTSAEALTRMSIPTLLVDMKVRDCPTKVGVMPAVRSVNFEMSKEALTTMLAGLHKIRDQLQVLH